jgi:hypothetical protein
VNCESGGLCQRCELVLQLHMFERLAIQFLRIKGERITTRPRRPFVNQPVRIRERRPMRPGRSASRRRAQARTRRKPPDAGEPRELARVERAIVHGLDYSEAVP